MQIILTDEQNTAFLKERDEHFAASKYGSYENFTIQEKSTLQTFPLNNGLHFISPNVINDPIYLRLRNIILAKMDEPLLIRPIKPEERIIEEF